MTIRLDGYDSFITRLNDLSTKDATSAGQSAVRAGSKPVLSAAKSAAPVSKVPEGALATRKRKNGKRVQVPHHKIVNSLKITKIKSEKEHQVSVSVTVGKAWHAVFVEYGSIHNAPNAFMKRALDGAEQEALAAMAIALDKQITKRGG